MPVINIKHLVSFSSEDTNHPAENILKPETYYKWRCSTGGERQASVLLQFEKASQIYGVDIGNNGSAFVEVLVGRSSWSQSEEFKVLLVASCFMSPAESKANKELTRVRMFGMDSFTKSVAEEKWDQVKVVCTQPYNQSEPYGLSFIKFHSPPVKEQVTKLGSFKLKEESNDDTLTNSSFFKKRMNSPATARKAEAPLSIAASARSSSTISGVETKYKANSTCNSNKISVSCDKRDAVAGALLQGARRDSPFPKMIVTKSTEDHTEKVKRKISNDEKSTVLPAAKKVKAAKKKKKVKKSVPLNKILQDVIFVLSGYQNPERGQIRDQGLSMGAKYEANWNSSCTHLVCAFANTPKYNQVKGKGKIVTKAWFKECLRMKRIVNTKSYRLDGGGDSTFESSSDDEEEEVTAEVQKHSPQLQNDEKSSSECDTEDELQKIRELQGKNRKTEKLNQQRNNCDDEDLYDGTTDEENNTAEKDKSSSRDISELADFFKNKSFFIYGDFNVKDRRLLKRYITAYCGTLEDYMCEKIHFVISNDDWDKNFDQALQDNVALVFVRPTWIFKCHEKQELIPTDDYEIKPL